MVLIQVKVLSHVPRRNVNREEQIQPTYTSATAGTSWRDADRELYMVEKLCLRHGICLVTWAAATPILTPRFFQIGSQCAVLRPLKTEAEENMTTEREDKSDQNPREKRRMGLNFRQLAMKGR